MKSEEVEGRSGMVYLALSPLRFIRRGPTLFLFMGCDPTWLDYSGLRARERRRRALLPVSNEKAVLAQYGLGSKSSK